MKEDNSIQNNTLQIFVCDVVGEKEKESKEFPSPIICFGIDFVADLKDQTVYSLYAPNAPSEWFIFNAKTRQFA